MFLKAFQTSFLIESRMVLVHLARKENIRMFNHGFIYSTSMLSIICQSPEGENSSDNFTTVLFTASNYLKNNLQVIVNCLSIYIQLNSLQH